MAQVDPILGRIEGSRSVFGEMKGQRIFGLSQLNFDFESTKQSLKKGVMSDKKCCVKS